MKQRLLLEINLKISGELNLPDPQCLLREKWLATNPIIVHMAQGLGGRNLCGSEEFGGRGLGLEVPCLTTLTTMFERARSRL